MWREERFPYQREKAEPCFEEVPCPIHGDIRSSSSFVQLCLSFTPFQRRPDLRSTQLLNIPEESVSFQESSAKTLMVCFQVGVEGEQGWGIAGDRWALAALKEATKEKHITRMVRLGREARAEKDKQTQSSTQRKSTSKQGRYGRSVFSAT